MLELLNTLSRKKEPFRPLKAGQAKIFTCGPSIYQRPHIGNYRTFLYEDVLVRYLEYSGCGVNRVMNITDVEDKSIEEARKRGEKMADVTSDAAKIFFRESEELKMRPPQATATASSTVGEAAKITKILMQKGHAYAYNGDIFFDPLTVPHFGKLYGLDMSQWPKNKVRFKRDTYNGNRWNRGDFILWHGDHGQGIDFWDSEVGRGRPSWNIQDPAIIYSTLGEQVDINCGGIDNIYRHHDYNIAIMEALTGKEYARIYLHGEHLIVDGKTMSKSRGNILYPENVYAKGHSPGELRFFLTAQKHYRKKLNFTFPLMKDAARRLGELKRGIALLLAAEDSPSGTSSHSGTSSVPEVASGSGVRRPSPEGDRLIKAIPEDFAQAMDDDLSLWLAAEKLEDTVKKLLSLFPQGLPRASRDLLEKNLKRIDTVFCCLLDN